MSVTGQGCAGFVPRTYHHLDSAVGHMNLKHDRDQVPAPVRVHDRREHAAAPCDLGLFLVAMGRVSGGKKPAASGVMVVESTNKSGLGNDPGKDLACW